MVKRCKAIVMLLLISLVVSMVGSTAAFAEEMETKGNEDVIQYYGPNDGIEVEELRTETAKQYLLPNGMMQYIASPDRIHWKDETGRYVDIDNSIVNTEYEIDGLLYTHTNKSNNIKMFFANSSYDNEYPIRIEYERYALSYGIEGSFINYVSREAASFPELLMENVYLENAVMYHADEGYDLVYIPKNSGEKEYIVIHEPTESHSFMFKFHLEQLIPEQTEQGVVFLNEEGNPIFNIGGLFAVDSNEIYCDEVEATLLEFDGETAIIRLDVDQEWISDTVREYPIIIDPTATICGEDVTYDSYISSVDANVNFYLSDYLRMGKDDDYGIRRTAIKFDLPSISSNDVISACINIRLYSASGSVLNTIYAHPITTSWSSSSITWNNRPSVSSHCKSLAMKADTWHDTSSWYTFKITTLAKRWLAGTITNNGAMLIDKVENNTNHWSTFYSSDYGYPNRPEFMVDYYSSSVTHYMKYYVAVVLSTNDNAQATSIVSKASQMGYSSSKVLYPTANNLYNGMPNNEISIIHGHGTLSCVQLHQSSGSDQYLYYQIQFVVLSEPSQ